MCWFCDSIPCVRDVESVAGYAEGQHEELVAAIWDSDFGAQLFNLITTVEFPGKQQRYYSGRKRLTLELIRTLLRMQDDTEFQKEFPIRGLQT